MLIYTHRMIINAPLDKVAGFHKDTRVLKYLSPPPVITQFHNLEPLGENSIADFTMWLGPLPVRWIAVHTQVDVLYGFTDTQITGPFKSWVHRHSFHPIDESHTEVLDEIQAEPSSHWLWGSVSRFMWLNLPILFAHRERVTKAMLEEKAG